MLADVITSTVSFPSAISSTSDTFIHITALPPVNSSTSVTRARNSSQAGSSKPFNIAYLAPLFAILGGIAGALCTWLLYRFVPRRSVSRQRETSLEPGPCYTPPSRFRAANMLTPAPLDDEDLARPSQASTRPLLDATAPAEKTGSWLSRAFSTRSRAAPKLVEHSSRSADAGDEAEDDPFLERSTTAGTPATAAAGLGRHGTARTTFSQRLTSPDPYGPLGDEEELAPYETLRHKSIRRGILERLRLGTLRRPLAEYERGETEDDNLVADIDASPSVRLTGKRRGHKRDDSDVKVVDMRSRTSSTEDDMSRRPTLSRNRSELVVSPPGFRLVLEDPVSGALMSAPPSRNASPTKEEGPGWGLSFPWQPSPTKPREGDDRFTALPVRRSQADKRGSPYASPSPSSRALSSLSTSDDGTDAHDVRPMPSLSRFDSSILPASPPMVRSPPLDSQLFFGSFGSSPSLDLRLPPPVPSKREQPHGTPPEEKRTKLKTQRSPPALPFPSTASTSPFRGRLKKTPTKRAARPPVATVVRNESADSVDGPAAAGRGTPAQRHEARGSALNRVSEILSRGWGERQLVVGEGARSPLMGSPAYAPEPLSGGASVEKLVDEEALNGMGIEQRLQASRGA